ncbi:hypothetical protein AMK06_CH02671 [Rhizobium sp. N541]|nr:hypothetical protein AMK05_CH02644 [Rhizobium sp. N324]ANM17559.1 hypothetical protein AMK06_CH02671 [Rhizobium sp. N541]ANM23944.1 hypothetical protein AMK07_CH02668 [Rhizobium sp. N941]OYD04619.1 hypothetical protein AMK08_CH102663 [Rhizobium sp. N4311]
MVGARRLLVGKLMNGPVCFRLTGRQCPGVPAPESKPSAMIRFPSFLAVAHTAALSYIIPVNGRVTRPRKR